MKHVLSSTAVLGLALLPAACGLDDYEQRMANAQARAQSYDDANAALGDPIAPVKISTVVNENPMEITVPLFLRPPKGMPSQPAGTLEGTSINRYPSSGVASGRGVSSAWESALHVFKGMYVAASVDSKDLKSFARDVLRTWNVDNFELQPSSGPIPGGAEEVVGLDFDDPVNSYSSYFVKARDTTMVGVIFQYEKGQRDTARKVINLALANMAVDGESGNAEQRFRKARQPKKAPPSSAPASSPAPEPAKK